MLQISPVFSGVRVLFLARNIDELISIALVHFGRRRITFARHLALAQWSLVIPASCRCPYSRWCGTSP